MDNWLDLILFLILATVATIVWGRINRIGYSRFITSIVHFIMKYSKMNAELIRSYLVWCIYMFVGLAAAVGLLLAYHVSLLRFLPLDPRYFMLVPLAFIAQNSLTGLLMQVLILARPMMNVLWELTTIPRRIGRGSQGHRKLDAQHDAGLQAQAIEGGLDGRAGLGSLVGTSTVRALRSAPLFL
jgi:hypothetical protein